MGSACGCCAKHAERIIKPSRRCGETWRFIAERPCGPPPGHVQPPVRINLIPQTFRRNNPQLAL